MVDGKGRADPHLLSKGTHQKHRHNRQSAVQSHSTMVVTEGEGTLRANVATGVLHLGTVRHASLEMTISNSVTADISRRVLAIMTTISAGAAVATTSSVIRISAMILATTEATISVAHRVTTRATPKDSSF